MTVCFAGGFGRNVHRAIHIPEHWKTVLLDSITDLPDEAFVLVAGLGSKLTEDVIKAHSDISHCILVKPFAFEHKDAQAERCLGMIPAGCKTFLFDNQKMADSDSQRGIAEFQKSLFSEIESKLQSLSVFENVI